MCTIRIMRAVSADEFQLCKRCYYGEHWLIWSLQLKATLCNLYDITDEITPPGWSDTSAERNQTWGNRLNCVSTTKRGHLSPHVWVWTQSPRSALGYSVWYSNRGCGNPWTLSHVSGRLGIPATFLFWVPSSEKERSSTLPISSFCDLPDPACMTVCDRPGLCSTRHEQSSTES